MVVKQYNFTFEKEGFKKDLKVLKRIKHLQLNNNGGFPVILSCKCCQTHGEILMTNVGENLYNLYNISRCFDNPKLHMGIHDLNLLTKIGIDLVSQLEVLHTLGFVHNDLKFQNLCLNKQYNLFTMIDFTLVSKLFKRDGSHKEQVGLLTFFGNSLFASEAQINLKSTCRKCDLQSLMYILCFLFSGSLPLVE